MNRSIRVCAIALGSLGATVCALVVSIAGCSSSSTSGTTPNGDSGTPKGDTGTKADTGATTDTGTTMACATYGLSVVFSPMYSAVVPGSNTHHFLIPSIVEGIAGAFAFSASPSNAVTIAPDTTTGGAMITVLDTFAGGPVTITAQWVGTNTCGKSTLNITATTDEAWSTGNTRYNSGTPLTSLMPHAGGHGGGFNMACPATDDAGNLLTPACIDCHGNNGNDSGLGLGFNGVSHTPQQAGGFSDEQLIAIFTKGEVPGWPDDAGQGFVAPGDAGYFDPSLLPMGFHFWHCLHQWGATDAEAHGLVTYLRAMTPASQTGSVDFGGHAPPDGGWQRPDGGVPDGGFHRRDSGSGGSSSAGGGDAATPSDASMARKG